jgi:Delta3-Delta2-enoyl-CoA isomerase
VVVHERGRVYPPLPLMKPLSAFQVHFGAVWPLSFAALLRAKFGDHRLQRKIALEGHRFTPDEALHDGILDYTVAGGTTASVLDKAMEVAEEKAALAGGGVWGLIKVRTE